MTKLTSLQNEIQKALVALGDRARFSEAILAKKIRENCKIEGKKKAGISLVDLEQAAEFLEESEDAHYSFMLNSANDLLIEKTETSRFLEGEVRQRRLKSEKSMSIFTNNDLTKSSSDGDGGKGKLKQKQKSKNRMERKSININSDFEDFE
ncbi:MAG: hypothetical protein K6A43_03305 [Treponema sp.]|nr:hypothetical protein [Treponema sp.]